jgi:metallo-beta-lactamase family protein
MYLQFHGAAQGVTGSLHRLHLNGIDIAIDCGLFQGHRSEAQKLNLEIPQWAIEADALVLSHAHLDHSGSIPTLVKRGFRGNIYCTPATRDLCSVMLRDSAMIQEQDARYINKRRQEDEAPAIEPLYSVEDAQAAVMQMISVPLHRPIPIGPGVTLQFHDSGHVLGSAIVELDLRSEGKQKRLVYTGDVGRSELPLLRDPEVVHGADILMIESTYGDRRHPRYAETDRILAKAIGETIARGGRVYIPAFALERAQELLFALDKLLRNGEIPAVPVYIDAPLAIAITEIYKLHPEALDPEIRDRILRRNDPFAPPGLHYVSDYRASREIQAEDKPAIIIAGSGMCEGGRILHHFVRGLGNPKNAVLMVGFQAEHTLGRRLIERRPTVKVLGIERDVAATIHVIEGLSAHADSDGLVNYVRETMRFGQLSQVVLVHGEPTPQASLAERLRKETSATNISIPKRGDRINL